MTNQEFLEFVKDGGYENSKYWTKEGETIAALQVLQNLFLDLGVIYHLHGTCS